MGELTQNCVKWLMFIFNFLFFVTGIALIAAGGVFQAKYNSLSHFFDQGITAPVLLIVVGVFISIISFLGCCGAARENYYMLMGFGVLVSLIFLLQFSGGIAALVQREKIPGLIRQGLEDDVRNYLHNNATQEQKNNVDNIQILLGCCGVDGVTSYSNVTNGYYVPKSCCIDKDCDSGNSTIVDRCVSKVDKCPVHTSGCAGVAGSMLQLAITGAGGVALGLAFIELVGIVFSCYLARRIRRGYTYA